MPAMAGVNMTAVEFNSLPGGLVELRFTFDGQAPEPKVYTIETPARIALDLNGVSSKLGRKKHVLDLGNTKSVNVVEAGGRTRIIVNLQQLTPHTARVEGNELIVSVGGDGKKEYLKGGSAQLGKESKSDKISSIASIDFRRGEKGEGRLIIELTNPNIDVNTYVEGKLIKLAFSNTEMPESLRLRYDVSDFATPVQWVKAHETSTGAALLDVAASGEYDYLAYQTQNTYVLTVKPLSKSEIEAKKREFAYVGDKLSLNFQDIEVRSVLQLIADFTDLNLVASDTVTGKITLRLQNVPWDQALDLILKTKGLDKRQDGNVLMVAPAAEIAEREQQEIATNKQREELAPLQTEFIRVRYAEAADIFNLLQGESGDDDGGAESSGSLLSARATVVVDARTNSLLITETAQKLEEIRHLINLIDVPVRQVLIEARIVVAASQAAEKLGIEWGASSYNQTNGGFTSMEGSSESLTEYGNALRNGGTFESSPIIDLGVDDLNASKIALGFFKNNKFLNLELSAIETAGQGEVVSQPKIITGDKQNAVIKSGTEIAYQETAPNGGTTTAFKDAALILDVTPSITPDDRIIMELMITQDSIGEETSNGVPTINTTELNTQVLVNNGETIVLGGIFKTEDLRSETKTPFLGDIPYLGRLFRKTSVRSEKTEILIFITPRILADNLVD
ncbi:MAG: type IV pilus secretin PilQ [Pseudomonadales bacterium]|nr:type IV pilus secretin PilQ [Pseudomonadales bacterium]